MSLILVKTYYDAGVYELKDMVKLVQQGQITKEEFFDIIRYNYDGITVGDR